MHRLIFLISVFLMSCFMVEAKVHKLPIFRQKSPKEIAWNSPNIEEFGVYLDWLKTTIDKHHKKDNRTNDTIPLQRFLDSEYYTEIYVGTPGQPMKVLVDTAWSLSWVISRDCPTKNAGCWYHNKYDHDHSSTYVTTNHTPYFANEGSYNLSGYYSIDTIKFAHSSVKKQKFVEMTELPYINLFTRADGILGLGLKINDINPFFYNLVQQSLIRKPIFAIYLSRDKQSRKGGDITLGAVPQKHIHVTNGVPDNVTYVPIDAETGSWQFSMDKVIIDVGKNYTTLCPNGCKALLDSSNNLIIGSKQDIEVINTKIRARNFYFGRFEVDCDTINKLPKINFIIAGKNFTLSGENYIQKVSVSFLTFCISAFTIADSISEQGVWILGGAFLSEFYSIYNIEQKVVGLVKAA